MNPERNSDRKYDVLCIGQAVIDCIIRGQEADRHRENVFRAERIELHIGGDAVNESIALTEMGCRARIACGVGPDSAGNLLRTELAQRGVNTDHITVMDTLVTPIAQLVVHQDGGRHSINSKATMLEGYIPDAEALEMDSARIVSFASLFRAPLDQSARTLSCRPSARSKWRNSRLCGPLSTIFSPMKGRRPITPVLRAENSGRKTSLK